MVKEESVEKQRLTKSLNILYAKAKRYREEQVKSDWSNSLGWFKGAQSLHDSSESPHNFWPQIGTETDSQTNLIFSHIMTIVPFIANRSPNVVLKPVVKTVEKHANEMSEIINRVFHRNDVIDRQTEMVMNGLLFGKGYWKTTWNDEMNLGRGDIQISVRDTRNIFLEPGKTCVKESNYLFDVTRVDKVTLHRMYPKKIDEINKAFVKERADSGPTSTIADESGVGFHAAAPGATPLTTSEAYMFDATYSGTTEADFIELVEIWFHDERTQKVTEDIIEKSVVKRVQVDTGKQMYPRGRMIVFSGDVIFEDRPNPFPRFPYVEFENYYIPGEPYSMSEVKQILNLQLQYNMHRNHMADVIAHGLHRKTYYDSTSGLRPDEISNEAGQYIPVTNVVGIKEMDPPSIPSAAFAFSDSIKLDMESVDGVHEIMKGQVPGDIRSGYAIEQLQESSANRMQLKTKSLEAAIREESRLITEFVAMFYEQGTHYHDNVDLTGVTPEGFEYHVKAGINLPRSSSAEKQFNQWLFSENIVDEQYIIENSDITDKQELMERMKPMWEAKRQEMVGAGQAVPAPGVTPLQAGGA